MKTVEWLNERGRRYLAARLGMVVTHVAAEPLPSITLQMRVRQAHLAPHDFVHGGAIMTLADSACGYGCWASLPDGASGFLTIEAKSNHIGAIQRGVLECTARTRHAGRTTQVWDAEVIDMERARLVAMFRCTQLILQAPIGHGRPLMDSSK